MLETVNESRSQVERIGRAALAPGYQNKKSEVPESLLAAIVRGTGDRAEVGKITREAFADEPALELVLFDTDRIGSYVFESSRPPVIQGASSILRQLNDDIRREYEDFAVFSGGGEGLLLLPSGRGAEVCDDIRRRYRAATDGALRVTAEWLAVRPAEFLSVAISDSPGVEGALLVSGTRAVLARLRDRVRLAKDERLPDATPVEGGRKRCVSCQDRAGAVAAEGFRPGLEGFFLCRPCETRWRRGREEIGGFSLEDLVEGQHSGDDERRSKDRYTGFLYADGNAMGELFGCLQSLSEIRFLSRAVAHVFSQAKQRADQSVLTSDVTTAGSGVKPGYLSFLAGGDEAVWILPAKASISIAEALPSWIEEEARRIGGLAELLERAGRARLTVGIGLVLCEHKFPVRYQFELAQELQKSAKALFYQATPGGERSSSLDFEVLTSWTQTSTQLETARSMTYRTEDPDFWRTCRPYSSKDFSDLVATVRSAAAKRLGKSQLFALQAGAVEGKPFFLNYLRYQVARNQQRYGPWLEDCGVDLAKQDALEHFFLRPRAGGKSGEAIWIPDALQLAPFATVEEKKEHQNATT